MNKLSLSDNPWMTIKNHIVSILANTANVEADTMDSLVEVPPDPALGDLATTVAFHLANKLRKNPVEIAGELVGKIKDILTSEPLLERVESKGPYVNIFLNRAVFAEYVVECIEGRGQDYGRTEVYSGKRALVESPAVNPSKPWHIGHTRNAVIGDTLSNILDAVGYHTIRLDYINDLGLQIAQLAWKLLTMDSEEPDKKYDHYLGHLYVDVQKAFDSDTETEEAIREVSRKLEDHESHEAKLSQKMVTDCVKAQYQTAYRLGIFHDLQLWESAIAHSGLLEQAKKVMLQSENIVKLQEGDKAGCIVARLDMFDEFKGMKEPNKVLFRSDGTRTYTGADVAFQMWKFGILKDPFRYTLFEKQPNGKEIYRTSLAGDEKNPGKIDLVFNVIGSEQAHPQRLIYKILELLGYEHESSQSHHIAYEFVALDDASFSGRKGTWIGYSCDDVLDRAKELALEEVTKRNQDESDAFKNSVAEMVGIGAVRYMLLKASPDRRITFRWEEALDFNGDASPYLQYAHARAQRILERAGSLPEGGDLSLLTSDAEYELLKALSKFPEQILNVVKGLVKNDWGTSFNSNHIASYCYGLATTYSKFYDSSPVLKAEEDLKNARLRLVGAFKITLANCLKVLGIPAIERM